jgi:hypothetical protein
MKRRDCSVSCFVPLLATEHLPLSILSRQTGSSRTSDNSNSSLGKCDDSGGDFRFPQPIVRCDKLRHSCLDRSRKMQCVGTAQHKVMLPPQVLRYTCGAGRLLKQRDVLARIEARPAAAECIARLATRRRLQVTRPYRRV